MGGIIARLIAPALTWIAGLLGLVVADQLGALEDLVFWLFRLAVRGALELFGPDGIIPAPDGVFDDAWQEIPAEIINIMLLVKMPEALAIVVSALIARFLIQLIPFVRWGS